jgi:hypothetical protein
VYTLSLQTYLVGEPILTMPQFRTLGGGFGAVDDAICVGALLPNDGIAEHPATAIAAAAGASRQRLSLIFPVICFDSFSFVTVDSCVLETSNARREPASRCSGPQEARVGRLARCKGDQLDAGRAQLGPLSRPPLPRRSKRETRGDLWESNERIGSAGGKTPEFQPQKQASRALTRNYNELRFQLEPAGIDRNEGYRFEIAMYNLPGSAVLDW